MFGLVKRVVGAGVGELLVIDCVFGKVALTVVVSIVVNACGLLVTEIT